MTLTLITPVGSNFIKDWPGQNAINCDRIDDYASPCLITHPLQSFNPPLGATTTDPTLGTGGFSRAYFYEIFDQIHMWGEWRFGTSGINVGSGVYTLTLPFVVNSTFGANSVLGDSPIVGVGSTYQALSNTGRMPVTVHFRAPNVLHFGLRMNTGLTTRSVRDTGIQAWAINDGMSWSARLQRIP